MIEPEKTASPGLRVDGQRLAGQRGLVDFDRIALQQARVRGHDVTEAHADDVARHELARRRCRPLAVSLHPGLDRQPGLQRVDGVARLVLFPEPHHGVGEEQHEDDAEVRPSAGRPPRGSTAASIIHGMGPQK